MMDSSSRASREPERGIALVLVMTVVLALAIVATPFVMSMILQERSGTLSRYESQADYGAEGAKNYALWKLMFSLDPIERRYGQGLNASYYWDSAQEFDIRLDEVYLTKHAKMQDPKAAIWGVSVQDEQGKLNVRSAGLPAVQRIYQMIDSRVTNPKDYLTMYSGRDATWAFPQRIRGMGQILPAQQNQYGTPGLYVDRPELFGPNSRVRATKPGVQPLEATVTATYALGQTSNGINTNPAIPSTFADGVLEVEYRHPINLNTARRETMIAMWEGLQLYDPKQGAVVPGSQMGRPDAVTLSNAFLGKEVRRLEQFYQILAQTSLSAPQKVAVVINAVCPSAILLNGTGTVPVCFKSYDVYTVEGYSSMNNPVGSEVAGRGFREVASVSPPIPLSCYVESQLDFDLKFMMATIAFQNAGVYNTPFYGTGFPFGRRFCTFPYMAPTNLPVPTPSGALIGPSDVALKSQQKPGPGGNEAYVQLWASRDFRGQSDLEKQLLNWPQQNPRDHFDDSQEGKHLAGTAQTYPWGQVVTQNYNSQAAPPPNQQTADIAGGGMELWVRFDSVPNPLQILDMRERDFTNRITLRIDNGQLILTVADSTINNPQDPVNNGAAEIRQPFTPQANIWYHFGAYWKGTRYAQLALLVDGFAHPQQKFNHVNPQGQTVMTHLSGAMTPTATSFAVQDPGWMPNYAAPYLIGNEIVVYDPSSGTMVRGARGTQAVAHPSGAAVSIWGYSSKVVQSQVQAVFGQVTIPIPYDRISRGGGTLEYNFGLNPNAAVAGDKQDPVTMQWEINATQNQIGVTTGNIMDYPDQGYLMINQEVVFYTARSNGGPKGGMPPATAQFTGCQRGQQGTVAAVHRSGSQVRMWSLPVTNYTNYNSPTIVQIGDEWFGPVWKDATRQNFWISTVQGGAPLPLHRGNGVFGSIPGAHNAGDKVIPTFLAKESDFQAPQNILNMGRNDWVTIVDAQNMKEQQQVRMAGPPPPPPPGQPATWPGNYAIQGGGQIAACFDNVTRDYVADGLFTRVLKFPSGELLGLQWLTTANPTWSIGALAGMIDEVKCYAAQKFYMVEGQAIGTTDQSMGINQPANMGAKGGLMKIGDEYVGYQAVAAQTVSGMKRGWLGSTAEVHDLGENIFALTFLPVSTLQSDLTPTEANLPLAQPLAGRPQNYTSGYVLVDNEMIGFEWNGGNGLNLGMPFQMDGSTGLYRGRFGTTATNHSAQSSLVYGMPWRYYDTYLPLQFDSTMCYYQWSTKMDLANWRTLSWVQEVTPADPNVVVHCLVRMDGKGEFYDRPAMSDQVLLMEFVNAGNNRINRVGHLNDAGQLDVRFYVEYKPGSFDAAQPWNSMSWKRTPKIKQIQVDYDRPLQTLYHEDR